MLKTPVLQLWTPRVGAKAASQYLRVARLGLLAAVLVWAVTFTWGPGFAYKIRPLQIVGGFLIVADLVVIFGLRRRARRAFFDAATEALGISVTAHNAPPRLDNHYDAWCQKNGVMPNDPKR